MRDFVYGDDVIMSIYKVDGYYPVACVEKVGFRRRTTLLPTSVPDSGAHEDYKYSGKGGWTASLSGVLVLRDLTASLWYALELLQKQLQAVTLDVRWDWTDKVGFNQYATGRVLIPEVGIDGVSDDFGRWDVQLQGTGPLDIGGTLVEAINEEMDRIQWIATGAEPNIFQSNTLIGKTVAQIMHVSWEGDDKFEVINAGDPTHKQVRLDNVAGTLRFLNNAEAGDYIYALVK